MEFSNHGSVTRMASEITLRSYSSKWVNNQWMAVSTDILLGVTNSFAVYNSVLYAGGSGYSINGYSTPGIVRLMDYPDTFLIDTTGIDQGIYDERELNIYPNPATEKLNIQAKENIQSIKVTNFLGEIILNQNYSSAKNEIEISVADLPAGIYFIRVQTKSGWCTGRFVKE